MDLPTDQGIPEAGLGTLPEQTATAMAEYEQSPQVNIEGMGAAAYDQSGGIISAYDPSDLVLAEAQVITALMPPATATYPAARATHEQVVADPQLFKETLTELLSTTGISTDKFPKIGGKELDIHHLYVLVTKMGGCERVISRKLWREIAEPFNIPPTITSVSHSLRKAYTTFLWDYEQVYFFRQTGQRIPAPTTGMRADIENGGSEVALGLEAPAPKKRKVAADQPATEFPGLAPMAPTALTAMAMGPGEPQPGVVGSKGTVNVDARFDCGYFVTVQLGRQKFRGMLYFPPPEHTSSSDYMDFTGNGYGPNVTRFQEKGRDPAVPKPNKTPFNYFAVDTRAKLKEMYPNISQQELTRKVGELWQKASDVDKAPYVALSNQDKARYQMEMEAYNYRLASSAAVVKATQAAQALQQATHALQAAPTLPLHLLQDAGLPAPASYMAVLNATQAFAQQQAYQQQQAAAAAAGTQQPQAQQGYQPDQQQSLADASAGQDLDISGIDAAGQLEVNGQLDVNGRLDVSGQLDVNGLQNGDVASNGQELGGLADYNADQYAAYTSQGFDQNLVPPSQ